jgi:hypothetical protein
VLLDVGDQLAARLGDALLAAAPLVKHERAVVAEHDAALGQLNPATDGGQVALVALARQRPDSVRPVGQPGGAARPAQVPGAGVVGDVHELDARLVLDRVEPFEQRPHLRVEVFVDARPRADDRPRVEVPALDLPLAQPADRPFGPGVGQQRHAMPLQVLDRDLAGVEQPGAAEVFEHVVALELGVPEADVAGEAPGGERAQERRPVDLGAGALDRQRRLAGLPLRGDDRVVAGAA